MSVTAGAESKNEDFRWHLGNLGFELSPASNSSLPCSACVRFGVFARWKSDHPNFRPLKPPEAAILGYRVADAGSGKGMGVFALKSFEVGELVLTEAPLVIYPRDPGDLDSDAMFDHLFASMNAADQKVAMAMANCKGSDMSPFEGILKTNVLGISLPGGGEGVPDGYAGLFPVMGRINHRSAFALQFWICDLMIYLVAAAQAWFFVSIGRRLLSRYVRSGPLPREAR
jgi:hypothetical protein